VQQSGVLSARQQPPKKARGAFSFYLYMNECSHGLCYSVYTVQESYHQEEA